MNISKEGDLYDIYYSGCLAIDLTGLEPDRIVDQVQNEVQLMAINLEFDAL